MRMPINLNTQHFEPQVFSHFQVRGETGFIIKEISQQIIVAWCPWVANKLNLRGRIL